VIDRERLAELKAAAEAYPFVDDGWEGSYTRDTNIKSIRYSKNESFEPYWPLRRNLKFAFAELFPWWAKREGWKRMLSPKPWWLPHPIHALHWMFMKNDHQPDGSLNNGCIITYWEEAGQFIEKFPPSVVAELVSLAEDGLLIREGQALRESALENGTGLDSEQ
jgi:hypothetical protein